MGNRHRAPRVSLLAAARGGRPQDVHIETDDEEIGQVNGLSDISLGTTSPRRRGERCGSRPRTLRGFGESKSTPSRGKERFCVDADQRTSLLNSRLFTSEYCWMGPAG